MKLLKTLNKRGSNWSQLRERNFMVWMKRSFSCKEEFALHLRHCLIQIQGFIQSCIFSPFNLISVAIYAYHWRMHLLQCGSFLKSLPWLIQPKMSSSKTHYCAVNACINRKRQLGFKVPLRWHCVLLWRHTLKSSGGQWFYDTINKRDKGAGSSLNCV